jgi:hypothetical protein
VSGRGAWPFYYEHGLDRRGDPQGRDAHGIYALKAELVYGGWGFGIDPTLPFWGGAATKATKSAQAALGIGSHGVLGPVTSRCLFRHRYAVAEAAAGLPPHALARIGWVETDDDPVAQGYDTPLDEGIIQENLPSNPGLTQVQCWTPSIIIPHGATQLRHRITNCDGSLAAGTVSWNVGVASANEWRLAGFPARGGPVIDPETGETLYAHCTSYWAKIQAAPL